MFDGGFYAFLCIKGDSEYLSVWAAGYAVTSQAYVINDLPVYELLKQRKHRNLIFNYQKFKRNSEEQNPLT